MDEDELIANLFRINQAKQKIKNENIKREKSADKAHYKVGRNVRKFIKENGGTMPEDLPKPKKSLKELKKEKKKLEIKTILTSNNYKQIEKDKNNLNLFYYLKEYILLVWKKN